MESIFEKAEKMPAAKKDLLYSAATEEFISGYKGASTDRIARKAGLSKGLIFHYFQSKLNLLYWCIAHSNKLIDENLTQRIDFEETDFFRRLWRITSVRFDLLAEYPYLFDFMHAIMQSHEPEVTAAASTIGIAKGVSLVEDSYFEGIDQSLFKERLDVLKAVNVVRLAFSALSSELQLKDSDLDIAAKNQKALQEIWDYISFFRKLLYK